MLIPPCRCKHLPVAQGAREALWLMRSSQHAPLPLAQGRWCRLATHSCRHCLACVVQMGQPSSRKLGVKAGYRTQAGSFGLTEGPSGLRHPSAPLSHYATMKSMNSIQMHGSLPMKQPCTRLSRKSSSCRIICNISRALVAVLSRPLDPPALASPGKMPCSVKLSISQHTDRSGPGTS